MSKDKKLTFKQKASISFVDQDDPPFLQQMKQKMGYRATKLEDKFAEEPSASDEDIDQDDIRNMKEEDRPQVVVLDPEVNISTKELESEIQKKQEEEDRKKIEEGKIVFRKPNKRDAEGNEEEAKDDKKKARAKSPPKKSEKPSSRLLSFGDDDDE
ncbi:Protein T25G3.1 [Aphelenchoides avenae]|nr:Protein T25G3.1 [Aphelenchus avenae]